MEQIVILLSTYNGQKYLQPQIDSLLQQSYENIRIIARDDGSNDGTENILKAYNIDIVGDSTNLGCKKSFAELIKYAVSNSNARYFMFCDQDDIWHNDKVKKTYAYICEMEQALGKIPILVHSDLQVVNEDLCPLDCSYMRFQNINPLKCKLENLIMQNVITGCTVMINRELAKKCICIPDDAIMHDWWCGLVASKLGAIGFLSEPTIKYRQHSNNLIGAKGYSIWSIISKAFRFPYKISISNNINQANAFLDCFRNELDHETQLLLQELANLQHKGYIGKRIFLLKSNLLKQGLIRNAGLFIKI